MLSGTSKMGECITDSRKTLSVRPAEMFFNSGLDVDGRREHKGKHKSYRIRGLF